MTDSEFLQLFDQHHNMVYRLALTTTKSPQDAEDIVQTVFLKLWKQQPLPRKERAWLAQVTVNACRDLMKTLWRRKVLPLYETVSFSAPEESALFDAVMALPAKYRVAVHLHYYEGYSYDEIGKMLNISSSAVSMRLHRARNLLRSSLKEEDNESLVSKNI